MALQQPKKPAGGAFGQFMAERRPAFIKQCPGKPVSEVSKLAGVTWKALSEPEKAPYQKKYEAAKAKYTADFEAFSAAGGVKEKGAMALRAEKRKAKEGGNKASQQKDPNKPKKPAGGAFGCFMNQNRPALLKECAGQPATASVKLGSTRWKALSEADKAVFEKAYQKKKAAYEEAMKSYVPPAGAEIEDGDDDEEGEGDAEQSPPAKKAKTAASTPAADADAKKAKTAASTPPAADADVLAQAKKDGFDRQLKAMLENPQVQSKRLSASVVLKALQDAGGKMVAAKKALFGGA